MQPFYIQGQASNVNESLQKPYRPITQYDTKSIYE